MEKAEESYLETVLTKAVEYLAMAPAIVSGQSGGVMPSLF